MNSQAWGDFWGEFRESKSGVMGAVTTLLCLLAAVSAAGQLAWVLWVWQLTESTGWPP